MASVGIFDSGIGGLSVWREIARHIPHADTVYVADQSHLPFGARDAQEILAFARGMSRFLVREGCDVIVVACNTASAVALSALRGEFSEVQFVGMEPAVKPAAAVSRSRVVAVLATPTTLHGSLFEHTAAGLNADIEIVRQPCPGLVEWIEAGHAEDAALERLLVELLRAPQAAGADTVVLACTHYPFVRDTIQRLVGPRVRILDPAPAVALQVERVAAPRNAGARERKPKTRRDFWTTGDANTFARVAERWLGAPVAARSLRWWRGELEPLPAKPVHDKPQP